MDMALREPLVYCTYPQYPAEPRFLQGGMARPTSMDHRSLERWRHGRVGWRLTSRTAHMPLPVSQTRILKKLDPGQDGTKKLVRQFGTQLVCVRYRQDRTAGRRYTTVEIVVDTGPMSDDQRSSRALLVRLRPTETALRQAVVAAGGLWDPRQRAWHLKKSAIQRLGLQDRLVQK